jgi:hypothetical protein
MHKLAVTNLGKLRTNNEIGNRMEKYVEDDFYLKLYLIRQEQNKNGVTGRVKMR